MNALELAALLGDLPDDIIVVDDAAPAVRQQKRAYLIPVFAAAAVMLIAFVLYPKLKMQQPDTRPEPVSTAASCTEQEETGTAPLLTDLSSDDAAAMTSSGTGSPSKTTGTTARTTTCTTTAGTARTTVTGQTAASGTTRTAAASSSNTTARTQTSQATGRTGSTSVGTRRTTTQTAPVTTPTTRRTTPATTTALAERTTTYANDCTTVEFESTSGYESAIDETDEIIPTYAWTPVFRSETETFPPDPDDLPGPVTATFSAVTDEMRQNWIDAGLIPADADLSDYDLIRADLYGEGRMAAVFSGNLADGVLTFRICYLRNLNTDPHGSCLRESTVIAVPKTLGVTPDMCCADIEMHRFSREIERQLRSSLIVIHYEPNP